jgi:hypothetical protein
MVKYLKRQRRKSVAIVAILIFTILLGSCAMFWTEFYALDGASLEQGQARAGELIIVSILVFPP